MRGRARILSTGANVCVHARQSCKMQHTVPTVSVSRLMSAVLRVAPDEAHEKAAPMALL